MYNNCIKLNQLYRLFISSIKMLNLNPEILPPQNYFAEEILLGTLLISPEIFPKIAKIIHSDALFLQCHQIIYFHLNIIHKRHKINTIELIYSLKKYKHLDKIGGIEKIIQLMTQSQIYLSSKYIDIYVLEIANIVKNNYIKRLMIQYGHNVIQLAYIQNINNHTLYNTASNYLEVTNSQLPNYHIQNFKNLIGNELIQWTSGLKQKKELNNLVLKSGFSILDQLTNGLPNGDLIIIAGRPSTGKTSLAINIASYIIKNYYTKICIFSLEMSSKQILYKFISIITPITSNKINTNTFTFEEWQSVVQTCQLLINANLYVDDTPNTSINYIEYTVKVINQNNNNIKIIIIDYLQLIQCNFISTQHRSQELSYITRKLKIIAQSLNIPVIVLSQLNRNIENRTHKKPLLSDLRESGCILYKLCVNLDKNHQYYIGSFYKNKINYPLIKHKDSTRSNFFISKHILFLEYLFILNHMNKNLYDREKCVSLTKNHRIFSYPCWKKQIYLNDDNFLINIEKKYYDVILSHFIYHIAFDKYEKTYDIKVNHISYFNIHNILLHNSIEQDADIIIILQNMTSEVQLTEETIIDVYLSKNRNGPTGELKLKFNKNKTIFTNYEKSNLTDFSSNTFESELLS